MAGIPQILLSRLRQIFKDCDEFTSHSTLYAIFADERLKIFQNGIPEAHDKNSRINLTISYLADKYKTSGEMR